jgi:hypothetical protein
MEILPEIANNLYKQVSNKAGTAWTQQVKDDKPAA